MCSAASTKHFSGAFGKYGIARFVSVCVLTAWWLIWVKLLNNAKRYTSSMRCSLLHKQQYTEHIAYLVDGLLADGIIRRASYFLN